MSRMKGAILPGVRVKVNTCLKFHLVNSVSDVTSTIKLGILYSSVTCIIKKHARLHFPFDFVCFSLCG